jgi:signal transduction histidine kinase
MIAKHGTKDPAIIEKSTDVITRSVQHLDRLVEDMLDVSLVLRGRMQLQPEIVDPVPLILSALEVVRFGAEAKQIQLVHHLPSDPTCVRADPLRCQQVLWNLLSNALKFTPAGGRIDISLWRERQVVVIAVKDSGIGMERAFVARVFERFTQANSSATRETRGLGLGLSIAKNLVELMGGTLAAESAGPNLGSTFTVRLPMVEQEGESAVAPGGSTHRSPAR